jgi:hypothetical protein
MKMKRPVKKKVAKVKMKEDKNEKNKLKSKEHQKEL